MAWLNVDFTTIIFGIVSVTTVVFNLVRPLLACSAFTVGPLQASSWLSPAFSMLVLYAEQVNSKANQDE